MVWVKVLKREASLDVILVMVMLWVKDLSAVLIPDTIVFDVRAWVKVLKREASLDEMVDNDRVWVSV